MTPKELQAWVDKTHGGNKSQAAASIGLSRMHLYRLLSGEVDISLTVELATKAVEKKGKSK